MCGPLLFSSYWRCQLGARRWAEAPLLWLQRGNILHTFTLKGKLHPEGATSSYQSRVSPPTPGNKHQRSLCPAGSLSQALESSYSEKQVGFHLLHFQDLFCPVQIKSSADQGVKRWGEPEDLKRVTDRCLHLGFPQLTQVKLSWVRTKLKTGSVSNTHPCGMPLNISVSISNIILCSTEAGGGTCSVPLFIGPKQN